VAADVATALLFLHSARDAVIHRDLKPANILLDEHLRAKLTDVGLAALLTPPIGASSRVQNRTHATTRIMGTPQYLDPDYLQTGHVSPAADVFAFGLVVLQLLTGRPLADGQSSLKRRVKLALEANEMAGLLDETAGNWAAADAETVS
jgi:serine/threonine protein kinase